MAEPEVEAAWRAEFKHIGETELRDALDRSGVTDESKKQATFGWLGDEAQTRRLQEEQNHHYARWIFFFVGGAVIAGLIAIGLALLR